MVSKDLRKKKFKLLAWLKSDEQCTTQTRLGLTDSTYEGRHSKGNPKDLKHNRGDGARNGRAKKTKTIKASSHMPIVSSHADPTTTSNRYDLGSLSDMLDEMFQKREMKQPKGRELSARMRDASVRSLTTDPSQIKRSHEGRDPLDGICVDLEIDEWRTPDGYESREGKTVTVDENIASLQKRVKHFLKVQCASMAMRRRGTLKGSGDHQGNVCSEVVRSGRTTVVIHYETRDALEEVGKLISRSERRKVPKDSTNKKEGSDMSRTSQSQSSGFSDSESLSSDEVRFLT
jgi:hypothetical protein